MRWSKDALCPKCKVERAPAHCERCGWYDCSVCDHRSWYVATKGLLKWDVTVKATVPLTSHPPAS